MSRKYLNLACDPWQIVILQKHARKDIFLWLQKSFTWNDHNKIKWNIFVYYRVIELFWILILPQTNFGKKPRGFWSVDTVTVLFKNTSVLSYRHSFENILGTPLRLGQVGELALACLDLVAWLIKGPRGPSDMSNIYNIIIFKLIDATIMYCCS